MGKILLDLEAVAELFGACQRTILTWEKTGLIPQSIKIGRHRFWHEPLLLKWLEERAASQIEEVAQ